ncbi:MAG TPA: tRNA 2-thiouridine(34) synthase MnmA [Nitrospinota bacterium]|nr:tRNA 2-thiouridine(34) synthase MnmA [Nitrospinota bacterium]|tara:strand:- start:157153 stop:158244 length:1092 start_codon:yes stop_codon:yes gene_type:complete
MVSSSDLIIAAMSGGVDSSITAACLKESGHNVVGITLKVWEKPEGLESSNTSCCGLDGINDAKRVAELLRINHYVLNAKGAFKRSVVDYFTNEYVKGRTPNPCVLCNQVLKFDFLFAQGKKFGATKVATGHYARVGEFRGYPVIKKGLDPAKDQSYFLFSIASNRLGDIFFPVGNMKKTAVREMARKLGLNTADKADSQEICFVPDNDYKSFIRQMEDIKNITEGDIVDEQDNIVGKHTGYIDYTVGQRRGLGISNPYPLYVVKIDHTNNRLIVGGKLSQYNKGLIADGLNWHVPLEVTRNLEVTARIRSRHMAAPAQITPRDKDSIVVEFETAQMSITPGQAVVFYHGDVVLGGGWIKDKLY